MGDLHCFRMESFQNPYSLFLHFIPTTFPVKSPIILFIHTTPMYSPVTVIEQSQGELSVSSFGGLTFVSSFPVLVWHPVVSLLGVHPALLNDMPTGH